MLSVLTETEGQTCCRGNHVNERVDGLHQLGLLPLQRRVVAAGEPQLPLQGLDGGHLIPDHGLETNSPLTRVSGDADLGEGGVRSRYLEPVLLLPHVLQLSSLLRLQPLDFTLQMTETQIKQFLPKLGTNWLCLTWR